MNQMSSYRINNREYTKAQNFNSEICLAQNENYLFDLSYLAVLQIEGEQAQNFLQGQLTCDVRKLSSNTMCPGALCNLKGRVQALFDLVKTQAYQIILPADLLAETIASLSKVAMLSRVKLQVNPHYKIYGFYLGNKNDYLPLKVTLPQEKYGLSINGESYCYCIDKQYFIIVNSGLDQVNLTMPFITNHRYLGSLAWHYLQVSQGKIEIYSNTRGLFLPHRLNLHRGYISFNKGCYKGQEIIARTHYRAKLKHDLKVFKIATNNIINAGNKLFDSTSQREIGEIIDYCPVAANTFIIIASILQEHPSEIFIEGQQQVITLSNLN